MPDLGNRPQSSLRMPFAGPETAMASTIDAGVEEIIVHDDNARPAAC